MLKLFCILIVVYFFAFAQAQSEESEIISLEDTCTPVPGLFIENRTREIECCDVIIANLYRLWSTQRVYLSKTLATLKSWNCTQLDQFCSNRSLAFTEYTALMYDRFCDESQLFQSCRSVVASAIPISGKFRVKISFDQDRLRAKHHLIFVGFMRFNRLALVGC